MIPLEELAITLRAALPTVVVVLVAGVVLALARALLQIRERRRHGGLGVARPLVMLGLTVVAAVAVSLSLPVSDSLRGQILTLLGILLTGVIAFSSTSFVSNAMAGLMLRAVGNFRPGDWVSVGDYLGRVTETGLFHTEIQTEDRDLVTLPNLHLATNPVKVVREDGTIVSASLSLGYDVHHADVEPPLLAAAEAAGLEEPFVTVTRLGDFSVVYRVSGFLQEVKKLITTRSRLHIEALDALHGAGIEIVSPNFMNQRALGERRVIPPPREAVAAKEEEGPEDRIFDKAEQSASLQELHDERERLKARLAGTDAEAPLPEGAEAERLQRRLAEIDAALAETAQGAQAEGA